MNIKTDPDSFVGLLGVDKSVLLLQSGNDLDDKRIFGDLSGYESDAHYGRGHFGAEPGFSSGFITVTNASYPKPGNNNNIVSTLVVNIIFSQVGGVFVIT